jgi:hypothetical protein
MKIENESAASFDAIRRDSCATVNTGTLTEADEDTGLVKWLDKAGQPKEVTLGSNRIRIVPRSHYRR